MARKKHEKSWFIPGTTKLASSHTEYFDYFAWGSITPMLVFDLGLSMEDMFSPDGNIAVFHLHNRKQYRTLLGMGAKEVLSEGSILDDTPIVSLEESKDE